MNLTPDFNAGYSTTSWWTTDGAKILFSVEGYHQKTAFYELPLKNGTVRQISRTEDHLSECSMDAARARASCVRQNSMTPPEIAVFDVADGTPRTLTHLNAAFDRIALGQVTKIIWKNKSGIETTSY